MYMRAQATRTGISKSHKKTDNNPELQKSVKGETSRKRRKNQVRVSSSAYLELVSTFPHRLSPPSVFSPLDRAP